MTEEEVFDKVVGYLAKINADAKLIDPAYVNLAHVRRADQSFVPRPGTGAYASISLNARSDIAELECFTYDEDEIAVGPDSFVVMGHARAIEWLFRVDIYGSTPSDVAGLFQTALRSDIETGGLYPLVVRQVDNTSRTGMVTQQVWEGRASFSFSVLGPVVEKMLIDTIETVSGVTIAGEVSGFTLNLTP